jgi:hypothetical protein
MTAVESISEINARIRRKFTVLEKIADGIVNGHVNGVIVSGAPGCGKSYTLETALERASQAGKITHTVVKGSLSAIALYQLLWDSRRRSQVLVIDDADSIYKDLESINLLKAALDTGRRRHVHYNKESRILADAGIDRSFDYEGSMVFITNVDLSRAAEKDTGMSPHYQAFLSRALYVDLGIRTRRDVLTRIAQVVFGEEFLANNNISRATAVEMVEWLNKNVAQLSSLDIRSVIKLVGIVKIDQDWRTLAAETMFK